MTERRRKPGTDKRKRDVSLTEQDIIDTALRMVQRSGAGALSMRALAKELGVTPMAIYHYLPSREVLLDRVRDSVLALVPSLSARRKGTRPKSERPLTQQSIVDAALRVIRRGGVDRLTMRAVADEFGVSAMALYHHVPDKEALLDRVREAVLAQVPTPPPQGRDWEAQMKAYALACIGLLASYPGLLRYGLSRPATKADAHLTEHGIAILLAAGFDQHSAALAIATYHMQIVGTLMLSQPRRRDHRSAAPAAKQARARAAGVAGVNQHVRELDFRESIEYGIDTVLSGLRLRLAQLPAKIS